MSSIYVASSWRNPYQELVVQLLKGAGHEVYDFKNPAPGDHGFHWSQVNPDYVAGSELMRPDAYLKCLTHPIAEEGFKKDYSAMNTADVFVLVLPCGRSAHLEMGWAIGQRKKTAIISPEDVDIVPELMYKMADEIFLGSHCFHPLLNWLGE